MANKKAYYEIETIANPVFLSVTVFVRKDPQTGLALKRYVARNKHAKVGVSEATPEAAYKKGMKALVAKF